MRRFRLIAVPALLFCSILLLSLAGCAASPMNQMASSFTPYLLVVWLFALSAVGLLTGCGGDNNGATFRPNVSTGFTPTPTPTPTTQQQASKLAFTSQPRLNGGVLSTFTVSVEDSNGDVLSGASNAVTISSSGAQLSGTLTVSAVNGVATFSNVAASSTGTSFTIVASSPGLTSATATVTVTVLPLSYNTRHEFLTNDAPRFSLSGDFNGDGITDVAVMATYYSSPSLVEVSLLLGNGDGSYKPPVTTLLEGGHVNSVAVGKFNGDASAKNDDLVFTQYYSNSSYGGVWVATFNSAGTATATLELGPLLVPQGVVVGEFNGENDIAVASYVYYSSKSKNNGFFATVAQWDANSTPTFTAVANSLMTHVGPGSTAPEHLVVGDFDGDGKLDIAYNVTYTSSTTDQATGYWSIQLGDGTGKFAHQHYGTFPAPAVTMIAADLNGDGKTDLVAGLAYNSSTSGAVQVVLGAPDSVISNSSNSVDKVFALPAGAVSLAAADLNGDKKLDLIVGVNTAHPAADGVATSKVLTALNSGNSGGGAPTFATPATDQTGLNPFGLLVADVNGDGKTDVVVTTGNYSNMGALSVLLGNGDGTLSQPPASLSLGGSEPEDVRLADVNGDGKLDIVAFSAYSGTLAVELGNGDGTFGAVKTTPVGQATASQTNTIETHFAVGDINGDGRADVVVGSVSSSVTTVQVLLSQGDGTFKAGTPVAVDAAPGLVALADVNNDGHLDLITGNLVNADVSVALGKGDGTFGAATNIPTGLATIQTPLVSLQVGAFRKAGTLDIAVVGQIPNGPLPRFTGTASVELLDNNGSGTFTAQTPQQFPSFIYAAVAADFNGDGVTDLMVETLGRANYEFPPLGQLELLQGASSGIFTATNQPLGYIGSTLNLVATDINGDGIPDIVAPVAFSNAVTVLTGNGDGSLAPSQTFGVGQGPTGVAVGDVNGDNKADIVSANYYSSGVTVLLHQ